MAIGVGFANDEKTLEDYYEEELWDCPIGAGGFAKDIAYERAVARYNAAQGQDEREQGFI